MSEDNGSNDLGEIPNALRLARRYAGFGWSIVPIPHGEDQPVIPWKEFQTRAPTDAELVDMFDRETGLGVVCGAVSGNLTVLDFRDPVGYETWRTHNGSIGAAAPEMVTETGTRVFLKLEQPTETRALHMKGIGGNVGELWFDGKVAVLPPTRLLGGEPRRWQRNPVRGIPLEREECLGILPPGMFGLSDGKFRGDGRYLNLLAHGASMKLRGSALDSALKDANHTRCDPPLTDREVERIFTWLNSVPILERPVSERANDSPLRHTLEEERRMNGHGDEELVHEIFDHEDEQGHGRVALATADSIESEHVAFYEKGSFINETSSIEEVFTAEDDEKFCQMFKEGEDYMIATEDDKFEWIVEGLLPRTYMVIFGGTSKSGKSCLLTELCIKVATGEPFLGYPTKQSAVLWLALEESEVERRDILKEFPSVPRGLHITHSRIMIDTEDGLRALRYWIKRTGARLIVIDPLYASNSAENLSDGSKARQALGHMKELCRTANVSAIFIHHFNKNVSAGLTRERFADSNQIIATASMDILMDANQTANGREIKLACRGRGSFANQTLLVRSTGVSHYELRGAGSGANVESEVKTEIILNELRNASEEGLDARDLAERLDTPLKTVRNRLTELIRDGVVQINGKRGRSCLYQEAIA